MIQTLTAMSMVTREIFAKNEDFFPIKPMDYGRFLVISLGTGSAKDEARFSAKETSKWGALAWLYNKGATPLIEMFTHASECMVDIHASVLFQALHSEKNYLRIQVLALLIFILRSKMCSISTLIHLCLVSSFHCLENTMRLFFRMMITNFARKKTRYN